MSISDLKFSEQEIAAKNITALADRPDLSAEEMKERLDSGDIRVKYNALIDEMAPDYERHVELLKRFYIFETRNIDAVLEVLTITGADLKVIAFFLDTGEMFCGTAQDLQASLVS